MVSGWVGESESCFVRALVSEMLGALLHHLAPIMLQMHTLRKGTVHSGDRAIGLCAHVYLTRGRRQDSWGRGKGGQGYLIPRHASLMQLLLSRFLVMAKLWSKLRSPCAIPHSTPTHDLTTFHTAP